MSRNCLQCICCAINICTTVFLYLNASALWFLYSHLPFQGAPCWSIETTSTTFEANPKWALTFIALCMWSFNVRMQTTDCCCSVCDVGFFFAFFFCTTLSDPNTIQFIDITRIYIQLVYRDELEVCYGADDKWPALALCAVCRLSFSRVVCGRSLASPDRISRKLFHWYRIDSPANQLMI